MKIKTITFHRAHNHGSVLQAYALQTFLSGYCKLKGIDCDYKIIDYYPEIQKRLYSVFKPNTSIKNIIKNIIALRYYNALRKRHDKFDSFVCDYLKLTNTYDTVNSLKQNPPEADLFISGSDQIWNVRAHDSSTVYYFDFETEKTKKISFAASFGPLTIDWEKYNKDFYRKALLSYDDISVREDDSAANVMELTGESAKVLADPTFLLNKEQWAEIENTDIKPNHPYILLYALEPSKRQLNIVNHISKKLQLPVVVLRYNNKNDWFNSYEKHYDAGPREFLSYVKHAELVLTTSFHGTAFSIIYKKPFYVIDGLKDSRISSILKKTGLTTRSIEYLSGANSVNLHNPDFTEAKLFIERNYTDSVNFIKRNLE